MSQWRELSPQGLDRLVNRQLGDASPTTFPAYRAGGSLAQLPDVRASLTRSLPLFQSLSLNDVREAPIERSVSPWTANLGRHSFDGATIEQWPTAPQSASSPELQKHQPFRNASSFESGNDRLQSIKKERRRIQNRNAQNTYRRRRQDLVSGLQDDNLRVRAENERLRKENRELKNTLQQISSVTLSLQYWLDGGFIEKAQVQADAEARRDFWCNALQIATAETEAEDKYIEQMEAQLIEAKLSQKLRKEAPAPNGKIQRMEARVSAREKSVAMTRDVFEAHRTYSDLVKELAARCEEEDLPRAERVQREKEVVEIVAEASRREADRRARARCVLQQAPQTKA